MALNSIFTFMYIVICCVSFNRIIEQLIEKKIKREHVKKKKGFSDTFLSYDKMLTLKNRIATMFTMSVSMS